MSEGIKGVVAQLKRYASDGRQIDSRIIFRPYCDWWLTDLHDYLAETEFTDIGDFIDEFGKDVAEKVLEGEIVEVDRKIPPYMEYRSCRYREKKFIKQGFPVHYPIPGTREDLVREF